MNNDCIKELMSIIEKQIPKKPDDGVFCPVCGGVNLWDSSSNGLNYCGDCGQKLDWSDSGDS